jgi:phage pi2 protein 07
MAEKRGISDMDVDHHTNHSNGLKIQNGGKMFYSNKNHHHCFLL